MNFISWSFVALVVIVMAVRAATSGRASCQTGYLVFLLVASFVFYGWHVPYYVGLLLLSTSVDWAAARWIEDARPDQAIRRRAGVVGNSALIYHPANAQWTSLKATATDAKGNTVELTVIRAYRVTAGS